MWPENTLGAFRRAYDLGLRWMETDLHVTADGVPVCLHDRTLDRTTSARGLVIDWTLAELVDVDATARFVGPTTVESEGIPTFESVVDALPGTRWVIDMKDHGVERPLAQLLARRGWQDRVVVGSFSDERLRLFRQMTGGTVATSTGPGETWAMWRSAICGRTPRLQPDALQIPATYRGLPVVTERSTEAFLATGAQIHVWTVNDADTMRRLLRWGVQGIITDRPDVAREVFEELGFWNEPDDG